MRPIHANHPAPYPVYASCFVDKDRFIICGGGGSSRTGVKNAVTLYKTDSIKDISKLDEWALGPDEDAPMSLAYSIEHRELVCGANASSSKIKSDQNENCRVCKVTDILKHQRSAKVFPGSNEEDYIRVAVISNSGNLLALASTNEQLQILKYPTMAPVHDPLPSKCGDVYDVTFGPETMVTAGTSGLAIYSIKKSKTRKVTVTFQARAERPKLPGTAEDDVVSFRAARLSEAQPNSLFTVINSSTSRKGRGKIERKTFIVKYDTTTWKPTKVKQLPDKGSITCFDVSADGRFLAFGNSSCMVGVLDARSLAPIFKILKAHDLPPTTLRFNPGATMLLSGSADNTIRLSEVPQSGAGPAWITIILIILTLLVLALAIGYQTLR